MSMSYMSTEDWLKEMKILCKISYNPNAGKDKEGYPELMIGEKVHQQRPESQYFLANNRLDGDQMYRGEFSTPKIVGGH